MSQPFACYIGITMHTLSMICKARLGAHLQVSGTLRHRVSLVTTCWALGLLILPVVAAAQTPAGDRFVVSGPFAFAAELRGSVAANGDEFVAVWYTNLPVSGEGFTAIEGRRLRADGTFLGDLFQVNSLIAGHNDLPDVAELPGGGFVVVWTSLGSAQTDNSSCSIQARRFAADGTPLDDQFQVNDFTTGEQIAPRVVVDSTGGFAVVWNSDASNDDDSGRSVRARIFDAGDNPVGAEFQVNTYTTGDQLYPSMAVSPTDEFVIVWHGDGSAGDDNSYRSVQARRYDSDGSSIGGEFQVNSYTTDFQGYASAGFTRDGDFLVVWQSDGSSGGDVNGGSIQARRFASDGAPMAVEFQVNDFTPGNQRLPDVHVFPEDDFVVVWHDGAPYFGKTSARQFLSDGTPFASQVDVSYPQQFGPRSRIRVAGSETEFVVVWDDYDYPPPTDISARGYRSALVIFTDGFESGDATAWSGP